jgi:hypothetical protein
MSRIGTGEGAQAYGHGLYFAGNERTAKAYRDALSPRDYRTAQGLMPAGEAFDAIRGSVAAAMPGSHPDQVRQIVSTVLGGVDDAGSIRRYLNQYELPSGQFRPGYEAAANEASRLRLATNPGNMYEVRLNTTPDRLLDWDAPLSAQPEVARRLGMSTRTADEIHDEAWRLMNEGGMQGKWMENPAIVQRVNSLQNELDNLPPSVTGADFYRGTDPDNFVHGMLSHGNSLPARSQQLREAGIDGIQYLDAGSRAAGDGTRNYVMFDDKLIDIMRRYGLAGLMALGASQTDFQPQSEQQ